MRRTLSQLAGSRNVERRYSSVATCGVLPLDVRPGRALDRWAASQKLLSFTVVRLLAVANMLVCTALGAICLLFISRTAGALAAVLLWTLARTARLPALHQPTMPRHKLLVAARRRYTQRRRAVSTHQILHVEVA